MKPLLCCSLLAALIATQLYLKRRTNRVFNIGLVARELGRRDESRRALQRFVTTAPPDQFGPDIRKAQNLLQGAG